MASPPTSDRDLAADRHAVLHRLRHAVRQDRPQAHHHGRLPAGCRDLLPAVQGADQGRQPRSGRRTGQEQGGGGGRPAECSFQFNPTGTSSSPARATSPSRCWPPASVSYDNIAAPAGARRDQGRRNHHHELHAPRACPPTKPRPRTRVQEGRGRCAEGRRLPAKADPAKINKVMVVGHPDLPGDLVTMVYGPIAAMLVEMFPTRIRYTSMSCRITSATAGSAACCPPRRLPSWRRPATCTTACGTPSSSRASPW
jgi:hypothetical protein